MHANQKLFEEASGISDIFWKIVQEKFDRKLKEAVDGIRDKMEEVTNKVTEEITNKVTEETRLTEYITLIMEKVCKEKTLPVIADELETELEKILPVYNLTHGKSGKNSG